MAISATAAEDTWFGRHEQQFRFGGGIYGANGGGSIVNIIDGNDVVGVCGSAKNNLARSSAGVRDNDSKSASAAGSDDEDEVFCERSSDEEYGRRLLLTALSAAAVVPSRRGDLAFEKWPFYHKKSYLFKPRRRPSLSNVVEIYENGHEEDKCSPVSGVNVVENASKTAIANGRSESLSAKVCAGSFGGSCRGDESARKNQLKVANDVKPAAGVSNILAASKSSPPRTARLFGSATDLREQNALKESCLNGIPAVHKARRASLSKSWYGEASEKQLNGTTEKEGYTWRRRSTFTSVPEDEDAIGEIATDSEERVVLLERSVSVPSNDALSTPPASRTKAMSFVEGMRNENGDKLSPSSSASATKLGKWSRSKIDLLVPSLKSLVTLTANKLSSSKSSNLNCRRNSSTCANYSSRIDVRSFGSPLAASLRRNISLNSVSATSNGARKNASTDNLADVCLLNKKLRKCNTVLTLSGAVSKNPNANSIVNVEPLRPINRLRVSPSSQDAFTTSRMCSRCSSLLSMASSSRYSLNSAHDFVPVLSPSVLCKVCLNEVPLKDSWTLQHCECSYCVDCVRSYVEFEINQGAYSISCPDAQCEKQGIIMLEEIESLVSLENIEKHKRYRLNKEVEMDKSRTWCPRAGCETVCTLCSTDRCTPQSVHCPTCNMDFCSNCRANWHADSPCKSEEVVPGVTFDSELIKCCPMCSVPIEKDEGCAQMLCKRCKHVFCWYCLASLDDDFLLRHYDKGPCKNKLGHSRASVIWHRTQVISIFAGFGILLLIASPLLLLAAPCIVCCKCRVCTSDAKLDGDDDIADITELQGNADGFVEKEPTSGLDSDSS